MNEGVGLICIAIWRIEKHCFHFQWYFGKTSPKEQRDIITGENFSLAEPFYISVN